MLKAVALAQEAQPDEPVMDVRHYGYMLQVGDADDVIRGEATISIRFLRNAPSFKIDLVEKDKSGKGMTVRKVTKDGAQVLFEHHDKRIQVMAEVRAGADHVIGVWYEGVPADGLIISNNKFDRRTMFGDNWPDRAHHWLPCVDKPGDKAPVDFEVIAPGHYDVVANGLKVSETALPGQLKRTHWRETAPLPTKVMAVGVADFAVQSLGDCKGIQVYSYVYPEQREAGFASYAASKDILEFFIKHIGPFPYGKLASVQSKTRHGGMENASMIFYRESSVDDGNLEDLMAHEIAHQWFGDSATEKSFSHLWLSEGFATYLASVYMAHKKGAAVLKQRMREDRATVLDFEREALDPVVVTPLRGNLMRLLNPNSYRKGGWFLHMLRRSLGEEVFWKGVRAYYAKFKDSNAGTDDFRQTMEQVSGRNLEGFFRQWLFVAGHPHLKIDTRYDENAQLLTLQAEQLQAEPYSFTLDILVDAKLVHMEISAKQTKLDVPTPSRPISVLIDPEVDLLASFEF